MVVPVQKNLILAILILGLIAPATAAVQCCVNSETNTCEEGTDVTCPAPPDGELIDGALCSSVDACTTGCCCATPQASDPGDWNLNEDGMRMNQLTCDDLGSAYEYRTLEGSCTEVCADVTGGTPPPTGDRHTITGTVTNGTDELDLATVYLPYLNSPYQDTTGEDGRYSIEAPEEEGYLIATRDGCTPHTQPITVTGDETIDIEMDCTTETCIPSGDPTITAEAIRGTDDARLTLTADQSCGGFEYYRIIREDKTRGGTTALPEITTDEYTDEGLRPNTEYCYTVAAKYPTGLHPSNERPEDCITTGSETCMDDAPEGLQWCENGADGSAVLTCNDDNTVDERACSDGQICAPVGDGYECVASPPCEQCNGIFGLLGDLVFSIFHLGTERACDSQSLEGFCYQDTTDTTADAYKSCATVDSCEDYRSNAQCGENPCGLPQSCDWNELYGELGKGVCQSTSEPAACGECDDIFGTCTENLCEAIGSNGDGTSDCYYDGQNNGLNYAGVESRCIHKEDMACRYYDNEADCTGGTSVDVDAQYDNGERTGGTHEATSESGDTMSIGLCDWEPVATDPAGGRCYKDADGKTAADPEDDCIENGIYATKGRDCLEDSTPPETQLIIPAEPVGMHEVASLDYTVTDDHYANVTTRFCISTSNCYPDGTLADAVAGLPDMDVGDEEDFTIRYYSYDGSGNLEPVKATTVTLIELGYPRLEGAELKR